MDRLKRKRFLEVVKMFAIVLFVMAALVVIDALGR